MKRVLLASAALAIGASVAHAAPAYTFSKDRSTVSIPLADAPRLQGTEGKHHSGGIFDNLAEKYKDGLYWCCEGGTVAGPSSGVGESFTAAIAFTPTATKSATKVTLGIGLVSGTNGVTVALYSDNGGQPGTQLASGNVTGLGVGFTCCSTVAATIPSTSLTAGTQYWVVVSASGNTFATWNASTVEQVQGHSYAFSINGGSWIVINNSNVVWNADVR